MQEERPEIKAWTNIIALKQLPEDRKEVLRLAALQAQDIENSKKKKSRGSGQSKEQIAKQKAKNLAQKNANMKNQDMSNNMAQKEYPKIEEFEMEFMTMVDLTEF